jgi:hypothetical protein
VHGQPRKAATIDFGAGTIDSAGCHTTLGSYSLLIDHRFSFHASPDRVKRRCAGKVLRRELLEVTRVDLHTHGKSQQLTMTDEHGTTVLVLKARTP